MLKRLMVVMSVAAVCVTALHAQYSLYFLQNNEFEANLDHWWTGIENSNGQQIPAGTTEWSSEHGGSARLSVDGAPCCISLSQCMGTFICPGDTITAHITQTDLGNFGHTGMAIGYETPLGQSANAPTQAGEFDFNIVSDRFYMPGTELRIWLVVWPGSGQTWIHYVRLNRAGSLGVMEDRVGQPMRASAPTVRAYPNPTRGRVSFSLDLPKTASSLAQIRIYDATGSLVKRMAVDRRIGTAPVVWDGTDEAGKDVATGAYYYNVRTEHGASGEGKVVVAR